MSQGDAGRDDAKVVGLGCDRRWVNGNRDQLLAMVAETLPAMLQKGGSSVEEGVERAARRISSAKQDVVRRHLAFGLMQLEQRYQEAVGEARLTGSVPSRVAAVLGKSLGQTRRYLAALDFVEDQDDLKTTLLLQARETRAKRTQVQNFSIDSALALAAGYGGTLEDVIPRPWEYIANTAALALRMSADRRTPHEKHGDAYLAQKTMFPTSTPVSWENISGVDSAGGLSPGCGMALYGLYVCFAPPQFGRNTATVSERIVGQVLAALSEQAGIRLPDNGVGSTQDAESMTHLAKQAIERVGYAVGSMLVGLTPYTKPLL